MMAKRILAAALASLGVAGAAQAHPHVYVTARSELVFGLDGRMKAVRHAWTFDDMFSSMAVQGLDANGDGKYSREELAPLAETNVTSLDEYKFFTFGKAGDKRVSFAQPVDYWAESGADGRVTLHFTLPVKDAAPEKGQPFRVEVYDPSYFVAFEFAKDNPAKLDQAPANCGVALERPPAPDAGQQQKLSESYFSGLSPGANFGAQFSNTLLVTCK
ncbi:DUF1007 family protein [Methylopila sp. M107]|uniref:DUF1007 family protein n=1 Tax=Methylopila sp. M107 TaxID=1101190 RepID=UPI0003755599|nr:DUF1007 family protein [Methylopila sp. M107]